VTQFERSALLPYSAQSMFELVNDIASYPMYLPGCLGAEIISQSESEVVARLKLGKVGLQAQFTTRNQLTPYTMMTMQLEEGPFSSFAASWEFKALTESDCKVILKMSFQVNSGLISAALGTILESTTQDLMKEICLEAERRFGEAKGA
jgi:ribosome-associated toxin RatA of RatAB toxin-antitoxin module